jgi:hypothetical protein
MLSATQESRELNIIGRFDYYTVQDGPQRGATILRFSGFGVMSLVGLDPEAVRVGDITVEISHSGFYTRARVWLKVTNGARAWVCTSELQENFYYTSYLA